MFADERNLVSCFEGFTPWQKAIKRVSWLLLNGLMQSFIAYHP